MSRHYRSNHGWRSILLLAFLLSCVFQLSWARGNADALDRGSTGASAISLSAEPQTRVFSEGLEGYSGVAETYIQHDSSDPHGAEQMVHMKETSYGTKRTLMRFDLAEIPYYMEIVEARLELFVGYRYPQSAAPVNLFYMLKPWDEATATWSSSGSSGDWTLPGAGGEGSDYETPAFATTTLPTTNGYHSVDITAAVQRWVQNPAANYGFMIRGASPIDVRCWSSEDPRPNERPRLVVTYRLPANITPPPTLTPTSTYTPIPAASPTATPANVVHSIGVAEVFPPDDYYRRENGCIQAGPYPGNPASMDVLLIWEGIPTSASLSFYYANNNARANSVFVNDQFIGRLPGANYATTCSGNASYAELPFDPAIVRSGMNKISIIADVEGETNTWSLHGPQIHLGGFVQGTDTRVVQIPSSYDGTVQRAMIQKPIGYRPGIPAPLVIALHGWGGRDYNALTWFAQAASDRGWLLACPDTRATFAHTPTKAVQRDIIDLIDWMIASPEYDVDTSRVYIVGSSMGGMMAAVIAAKYQ
ncbi:MAG: DNRLRE domain-containing protein, partial [Chloroflexi bacterium]|nr:DNRLRE domain-containing protein [Chloroflexota bacterium]